MLLLQLKSGEYLTIGKDVVVQLNQISGDRCKLMVDAPREIPVVRGELLERAGENRPDCVSDTAPKHRQSLAWNRSKSQTLASMRRLLRDMDSASPDVKQLRRQLDFLFPPEFASNETVYAPN